MQVAAQPQHNHCVAVSFYIVQEGPWKESLYLNVISYMSQPWILLEQK